MYDSTNDTLEHIRKVRGYIRRLCAELRVRGTAHDKSKLIAPEKPVIDQYTPRMKKMAYNSPEYNHCLHEMDGCLEHHYHHNRHHPQHFENGINGMNLIDLVEMFCDWYAASQRNIGGDPRNSIEIAKTRFGLSDQLTDILNNTLIVLDNKTRKPYQCLHCGRNLGDRVPHRCQGTVRKHDLQFKDRRTGQIYRKGGLSVGN